MTAKARSNLVFGLLYLVTAILLFVRQTFAHTDASSLSGAIRSLDVYAAEGKQHLLLGKSEGNGSELFYFSSANDGGTWSEPIRVDAGIAAPHGLARGNDAQIAAAGDHLIAVWETGGTDQWGGGPMATALSDDGGNTWYAGPNPADDNLTRGHISIDLAADAQGAFHLVWFDDRSGKQGLRYARSEDAGKHWSKNSTLDPETCECCWNIIQPGKGNAVYAFYRDKDPRDMALAASTDAGKTWRREATVAPFGWQINGCPEVGGSLALTSKGLHAVVWTGKADAVGLYDVVSTDGGANWATQRRLGDRDARHADVASRGDTLAVSWDALTKGLFTAVSNDGGRNWTTARVAGAQNDAAHPRLLATKNGFRVFWTETADGQNVWRSARVGDAK